MQKKTGRVDLDSWRLLCSFSQREDNGDGAWDANIDVEEEEGRGWVCRPCAEGFPVLGWGRDARRRRRNPMLGFDGRRLGPWCPIFLVFLNRYFHLSVSYKGNLYRGNLGNQMMYVEKCLHQLETNSKDL
jgi:hypothetical protein